MRNLTISILVSLTLSNDHYITQKCPPSCGKPPACIRLTDKSTRPLGEDAIKVLKDSGLDLIINPEDAEPSRQWVLENLSNPEVHGVCIMHPHKSDIVDEEFLNACNKNMKVVSTCSVGYGPYALHA